VWGPRGRTAGPPAVGSAGRRPALDAWGRPEEDAVVQVVRTWIYVHAFSTTREPVD
jgi:hypothetical protein